MPYLLLAGNTHDTTTTTGSLGVLTTDLEVEGVTNTTVRTNLLETFHILTILVIEGIGEELRVLSVLAILLTIEEPIGDLVLARVLHDGNDAFHISSVHFTGTLAHVNLSLTTNQSSVTTTTTLDGSEGELNLLLTVNVGVENTQNVLERRFLRNVQRLKEGILKEGILREKGYIHNQASHNYKYKKYK